MKQVLLVLAFCTAFPINPMGPPGGPAVVAPPAVSSSGTDNCILASAIGVFGTVGVIFAALAGHSTYRWAYPLPFNVNRTGASCDVSQAEWPILQSELDIIGEYTDKTCIPVCASSNWVEIDGTKRLPTGSQYGEKFSVERGGKYFYILCKNGSWVGAVKSIFKQLGVGFEAFDTLNEQGLVIPTEYADSVIDFEAYNEMLLHEEEILRHAAKKDIANLAKAYTFLPEH